MGHHDPALVQVRAIKFIELKPILMKRNGGTIVRHNSRFRGLNKWGCQH